jgi:hypothetical protein
MQLGREETLEDRSHFRCVKPRDEGAITTQTLQIKKRNIGEYPAVWERKADDVDTKREFTSDPS